MPAAQLSSRPHRFSRVHLPPCSASWKAGVPRRAPECSRTTGADITFPTKHLSLPRRPVRGNKTALERKVGRRALSEPLWAWGRMATNGENLGEQRMKKHLQLSFSHAGEMGGSQHPQAHLLQNPGDNQHMQGAGQTASGRPRVL